MKKTVILTLTVACLYTACKPKNNYLKLVENDWKKADLKGRVKKVVNNTNGRQLIYEYNKEGFLERSIDSSFQTEVVNSSSYKYDFSKNTTYATRSEDGKQMWEDVSKYDDKGNLVEMNSSGISKWVYTYDDKNRKKEMQVFGFGNILVSKQTWEYKPDGSTVSVEFDEQNHYKKSETIDADSSSILSLFDTTGNKRAMWVSKKDKAGKIVYHEVWEQGRLSNYSKYFYNQYGDEVMNIAFSTDKNKTDTLTWEYAYDKMGNWISVKSSMYGANNREITYW